MTIRLSKELERLVGEANQRGDLSIPVVDAIEILDRYRLPQTVSTEEELNALSFGSIVITGVYRTEVYTKLDTLWLSSFNGNTVEAWEVAESLDPIYLVLEGSVLQNL